MYQDRKISNISSKWVKDTRSKWVHITSSQLVKGGKWMCIHIFLFMSKVWSRGCTRNKLKAIAYSGEGTEAEGRIFPVCPLHFEFYEHMNVLPIEKNWVKLLIDQLNKGLSHWLIYKGRDVAVFVSIIKKKEEKPTP